MRNANDPMTGRYFVQRDGVDRHYPELFTTVYASDDLDDARRAAATQRNTIPAERNIRIADTSTGTITEAVTA